MRPPRVVECGLAFEPESHGPAHGPYDGILMAAAPLAIPEVLFQQLAPGGRLIAPVGPEGRQQLLRLTRRGDELHKEMLGQVSFVPLLKGTT